MTRISRRARGGLRSTILTHRTSAQSVVIPSQDELTELAEAHVWAVNAAVEAGQDDLAYELADRYLTA